MVLEPYPQWKAVEYLQEIWPWSKSALVHIANHHQYPKSNLELVSMDGKLPLEVLDLKNHCLRRPTEFDNFPPILQRKTVEECGHT